MGNSNKTLVVPLNPRDVSYMKPEAMKNYFTLAEVSRETGKDQTWIRKLESDNRIPRAKRVKFGKLMIRLWSPNQVAEMKEIFGKMRRGRPSGV